MLALYFQLALNLVLRWNLAALTPSTTTAAVGLDVCHSTCFHQWPTKL